GMEGVQAAKRTAFNAELVRAYYEELSAVARAVAPEGRTDLLAQVLRMPEVMAPVKDEFDPAEWGAVAALADQACAAYDAFRVAEGAKLHGELKQRTANITALLEEVAAMDGDRIRRTRERLLARLEELRAKVDQERFEQ